MRRARAFAAALQCGSGGCGKCTACRTSLSGSHPDVTLVRTELLSIGVDEVRELVRRSAMSPTLPSARPWDGGRSVLSRTPIGSPNVAPMPC
jgi:DNA polymerase III subunit delta'